MINSVLLLALTFALFSPEQAQVLAQATGTEIPSVEAPTLVSYVMPTVLAVGGAVCTGTMAWVRQSIAEGLRAIDPENSFGLHWVAAGVEECLWVVILAAAVIVPFLALLLVVCGYGLALVFRKAIVHMAERRRRYWEGKSRPEIARMLDIRAAIVFIFGFLISAVPFVGFLLTVLLLNVFVFGVFRLYEKLGTRWLMKFVFRVAKISFFLFLLVFSGMPFAGAAFLLPYLVFYWLRRRHFLREAAASV